MSAVAGNGSRRLCTGRCNFCQNGDAMFSKNILQLSPKKACKKHYIIYGCYEKCFSFYVITVSLPVCSTNVLRFFFCRFILYRVNKPVLFKGPLPVAAGSAGTAGFFVSFVTAPGQCKRNADFSTNGHNMGF